MKPFYKWDESRPGGSELRRVGPGLVRTTSHVPELAGIWPDRPAELRTEEATGGLTNPLYNLPGSRVGTPSLLPAACPTALSCYGEPESSGDIARGGTAGWPDANGAACPRLRFSAA